MEKTYAAIDLKSFYASVECVDRGLDPLSVNLVVADLTRTEKTICLAVSPSLKANGIPGRARLFEVVQKVREVNAARLAKAPGGKFRRKSYYAKELAKDPGLELDYIVAQPQMARYMQVSNQIYEIYLKYVAPEDIFAYSVDEVFIDISGYLKLYGLSAEEFTRKLVQSVLDETGITATAGIGPNMYLAKIAMDVWAKHIPADAQGVRIASLTEQSYREQLWDHKPITDFWRVGPGTAKTLAKNGMFTMGDIARCSEGGPNDIQNEDLLYRLFGKNAELLIDHAWGWEPCTMADVKSYRPEGSSLSNGQVLSTPYTNDKAKLIVMEMTDQLVLALVDKRLTANQMVLTVGYDTENLRDSELSKSFSAEIKTDRYGRKVPESAHGSINLGRYTSSEKIIMKAVEELFDRITDKNLTVRRMYVVANNVVPEGLEPETDEEQLDLFTDYEAKAAAEKEETAELEEEKRRQQAILDIKKKFGKNAILKGMNFEEGATAKDRNKQIGGHRA